MSSRVHIQFAKFLTVGIVNTAVDWVVFFVLTLLPFFVTHRPLAKALSFVAAVVNSFLLNSYWTFRKEFHAEQHTDPEREHRTKWEYFVRFCVVSVLGWVLNTTLYSVVFALSSDTLPMRIADLLGLAFASGVVMAWNFFGNKFWTYTQRKIQTLSAEERRSRKWFIIGATVLIVLQLGISVAVMRGDSATIDEVAHIADGYAIVAHQDYRLNPEHPPLTKVLAALPLRFMELRDITEARGWEEHNQWIAGRAFLYFIGNDADQMLFVARLPMLVLLLVLDIYVLLFARERFSRRVALVILFFFALAPELLAHGHLVTTDVGAAVGFTAATFHFSHFLQKQTRRNLIIAGAALGVAQLLKFSAVLLLPIDLVLIVLWCVIQKRKNGVRFAQHCGKLFLQFAAMCVIALSLVWLVYIPSTWNTPVEVEHALIDQFVISDATWVPAFREQLHALADRPIIRAVGHYALGVYMVFKRVEEGNTTFILGQFSDKTIWWFFPVAWVMKTAIPIMLLFSGSMFLVLRNRLRRGRISTAVKEQWTTVVFLTPVALYWLVTLFGSLNLGVRHLLPTLPFVLLFSGEIVIWLLALRNRKRMGILAALMVWMAVSVGVAYPHYLSYFNEFTILQPKKYELLVDSSLDWGQDAKRLAKYVEDSEIDEIYVDYFGGGQPDRFMSGVTNWHSYDGPVTGYLAVSATFYQFSLLYGEKEGRWSYDWLRSFEPIAVIGNSILVYHISEDDLREAPPTSPYPITQPPSENIVDPDYF